MTALDFSRFECLTFDCYGTLIDWETGILEALRPILAVHRRHLSDEGILELYAALEAEMEAGDYRPYREILQEVVRRFGVRLAFTPTTDQAQSLPQSLRYWKPFPDTVAALRQLKTRYKLAIVSNVDDDLFAHTARLLGVPFDYLITAQQVRSYKPSLTNFQTAMERIGLPAERILHVAQSLFHDVVPAKRLGLTAVWVNRRSGKRGGGATPSVFVRPDLEVPDLATLAAMAVPGKSA